MTRPLVMTRSCAERGAAMVRRAIRTRVRSMGRSLHKTQIPKPKSQRNLKSQIPTEIPRSERQLPRRRGADNRSVIFRTRASLLLLLFAALLTTSCGGDSPSSSTPLPSAPFSQVDLLLGTGETAANGRNLTVYYTLWLYDPAGTESKGRQIESNVGGTPFPFTLGVGR